MSESETSEVVELLPSEFDEGEGAKLDSHQGDRSSSPVTPAESSATYEDPDLGLSTSNVINGLHFGDTVPQAWSIGQKMSDFQDHN